jgi:potassium efflux system protein
MRLRFQAVSEIQEQVLKRAAVSEEKRAAKAGDPLERYRARRNAELLDMEAQTVKFEQTFASNPRPFPEEQRKKTDLARENFERMKRLIQDGQVSRLDVMRLNNEFRKVGPARERIVRDELAVAEARVEFYGDLLTEAELELIEDAHQDQFEHDAVLERLPAARHAEAGPIFEEIERRHAAILTRRKEALRLLANRAVDTLQEVTARLDMLDEESGFIRTSVFWVRDQDPIGPDTVEEGGRELTRLSKAVFRLTEEALDRRNWSRASAEFAAAAAGLLVLPLGLRRLRRKLGEQIAFHLPDPEPPGPTPDPNPDPDAGQPQPADPD